MQKLWLINKQDKPIGELNKLKAHLGKGRRHRAFTAILQNNKKEILITRRSLKKPLWPTFWDISFSSHPWVGESLEKAGQRRAKEELGISLPLSFKHLLSYEWHERWNEVFSEWEINHLLLANYSGQIEPDPGEIREFKWLKWEKILKWAKEESEVIVPWVKIILGKIRNNDLK